MTQDLHLAKANVKKNFYQISQDKTDKTLRYPDYITDKRSVQTEARHMSRRFIPLLKWGMVLSIIVVAAILT